MRNTLPIPSLKGRGEGEGEREVLDENG